MYLDDAVLIRDDLYKIKDVISKCKILEENLWRLLDADKRGQLKDEHAQLMAFISKINGYIKIIDADKAEINSNYIHSYIHNNGYDLIVKLKKELDSLEQLLEGQESQLVNVVNLSHERIFILLNGDKNGNNISQTSQGIKAAEEIISSLLTLAKKLIDDDEEKHRVSRRRWY